MTNLIHVIDSDNRRRTRICRELSDWNLHAEIYEDMMELGRRSPCEGYIFAADDADGGNPSLVEEALQWCGAALPVVIYAGQPATEKVVSAMLSGASGFLEWPFKSDDLDLTFQRLAAESERRVRQEQHRAVAQARVNLLTPREKQVLALVVEGFTNKSMARALQISYRTVEIHRGKVMRKLNARSAAEAVRIALHTGYEGVQFAG